MVEEKLLVDTWVWILFPCIFKSWLNSCIDDHHKEWEIHKLENNVSHYIWTFFTTFSIWLVISFFTFLTHKSLCSPTAIPKFFLSVHIISRTESRRFACNYFICWHVESKVFGVWDNLISSFASTGLTIAWLTKSNICRRIHNQIGISGTNIALSFRSKFFSWVAFSCIESKIKIVIRIFNFRQGKQ